MYGLLNHSKLLALSLLILLMVTAACSGARQEVTRTLTTDHLEAEAQSIDESLICPSCPGKTIGQAQVAQAAQMRLLVREKLAEGWSRQQILDYFAERYEGVLAEPPKEGFTLLAWVLPLVGIVGAMTALYFVIRAMRRKSESQPSDENLEKYMEQVDRDLGYSSSQSGPSIPPPDTGDV